MADFDSQLPVRALATEFTTEVANSSGTTIDPVEEFAQGSTTSGQSGPLTQAAVSTLPPVYLDGTTAPLSLDPTGNLRIAATITPSGTQDVNITEVGGNPVTTTVPVSGTVTADQGAPNSLANAWPVEITDGTNVLGTPANPVRVDPTGTTTQPVSGTVTAVQPTGTNLHVVTDSGSTTAVTGNVTVVQPTGTNLHTVVDSGTITANAGTGTFQTNMAQVSGTATSVNTGNADAGTQRVVLATDQPAVAVKDTQVELPQYNTASAIAANASSTQTYSPGSTVLLDGVDASASGQMKIEVQYGTTGGETTKWVGFTSKGNLQSSLRFPHPISITNTMSVKVIRTNTDNQAMDVYSTIMVH